MADSKFPRARIIFVNRFYWPEEPATAQLLTDLAAALAGAGHRVTVIASHSGRRQLPRAEVRNGVEIKRVRGTRWASAGAVGKAMDFLTFSLGAFATLLFTASKGDAVIALTDPPLIGVGAWLAARARGARIFHWVQDIYPEIAMELTGHRWLGLTRPLRNAAWRNADGCVVLGADMKALLVENGTPSENITISPNWAPGGLGRSESSHTSPLRAEWNLEGQFVVAYSGNLGRVHDLEPVIELAAALRDDPRISFLFIGGGAQRDRLQALAAARRLARVQFRPAQPRERLGETLALGDVHLVTLLPGCERLVFPSKLYGVTAAGRPVIFIGPRNCELAREIERGGFGHAFERGEIERMAAAIRALSRDAAAVDRLARASLAYAQSHLGPGRALSEWERVLGSTTAPRLPLSA